MPEIRDGHIEVLQRLADVIEAQRDKYYAALVEILAICGADKFERPAQIDAYAVQMVGRLREDYDGACEELARLGRA